MDLRYPGEFEAQETVWFSWTSVGPHCASLIQETPGEVLARMAGALVGTPGYGVSYVTVLVNDDEEAKNAFKLLEAQGLKQENVKFVTVKHDEEWIRDFGPIFLKSKTDGSLSVATFGWNHWGCANNYENIQESIEVHSKISSKCAEFLKLPTIRSDLVSEGGNREFNGAGVMIATAAVEKQRNPEKSIEEIETELKRVFNLSKVIWLEEGVMDDDHVFVGPRKYGDLLEFNTGATGGHIDEFCRFIDTNTIVLSTILEGEHDVIAQTTHARMERNLQILESEAGYNLDGKPFTIVRIPAPPTMRVKVTRQDSLFSFLENVRYSNGLLGKDLLHDVSQVVIVVPTSYMNMVICNKVVLIPRYGTANAEEQSPFYTPEDNARARQTDELAVKILQQHFPSYQIRQISVVALNLGGGGMHCVTQQQPKLLK